jgi:hypothetical protein
MKNSGAWVICVQVNNLLRSSTVRCLVTHTDKIQNDFKRELRML